MIKKIIKFVLLMSFPCFSVVACQPLLHSLKILARPITKCRIMPVQGLAKRFQSSRSDYASEMSRDKILNKVVNTIAQHLDIKKSMIATDATWRELGVDSLGMVEIVMNLEQQFNIQINDEKASKFRNINDIVDCIQKLKAK